ncbi:MAG: hypothetical protein EZS28_031537 [Streblomastix strix]|uniref:Uncharacterized protein n=1 Tax=Streblomastix strix TaxID=222440 RepID=A0A5J4URC7_9EUKA|nr:MAG: hypothetical protein EZS28_031537 [Streblomastix strix]
MFSMPSKIVAKFLSSSKSFLVLGLTTTSRLEWNIRNLRKTKVYEIKYDSNANWNDFNVFAIDREITVTDTDARPALRMLPKQDTYFFYQIQGSAYGVEREQNFTVYWNIIGPWNGSDPIKIYKQLGLFASHMSVLDTPAITVERENQQLDQHAEQPLPVPESHPAKNDAVLPFMKNIFNQATHIPEELLHQQLIASVQHLIEQYNDEKVADYDRNGKFPTKYEAVEKARDLDLEFEAEVQQLAVDCQRDSAAIIACLATNDAELATELILTYHCLVRVIAGKAQQHREQALAPSMFKNLLCQDISVSDKFEKSQKKCQKNKINICYNLQHSYKTNQHRGTKSPLNSQNRNESRLTKTLRITKQNKKPEILNARTGKPSDQHSLYQKEEQKEGIILQYSIDLGKTSVPNRLMASLDYWDEIGGTQTIIIEAQPEWISPAVPFFFQSQQQPCHV